MKKIFYTIPFIIAFAYLLSACEKKYEPGFLTTPPVINSTSEGTIISATPNITEYPSGIALNNTHTVTVQVNVTKIGTYNITTDTVNKIYFNANGSFNSTGSQTVILQGHDIPDTSGICNLTIKYGTSQLSFSANIYDWWEFQERGGNKYIGKMDSIFLDEMTFPTHLLIFEGTGNAVDRKMVIIVDMGPTDDRPTVKHYVTNDGLLGFFTYGIVNLVDQTFITQFYNSDRLTTPTSTNTDVQIYSYNSTTRMIDAYFSGTAITNTGNVVQIVQGKLRGRFRP